MTPAFIQDIRRAQLVGVAIEVFAAVVRQVYAVGEREVLAGVAAAPSPRDALPPFVVGSVDFYALPRHMQALTAIPMTWPTTSPACLNATSTVGGLTTEMGARRLLPAM